MELYRQCSSRICGMTFMHSYTLFVPYTRNLTSKSHIQSPRLVSAASTRISTFLFNLVRLRVQEGICSVELVRVEGVRVRPLTCLL